MSTLDLWTGMFGDNYHRRNKLTPEMRLAKTHMWKKILSSMTRKPETILEVGAGMGYNITALRSLIAAKFMAVEPNKPCGIMLQNTGVDVELCAAHEMTWPDGCADLVFTSGVLIHVPPTELSATMAQIYRCSKRWIVCVEYFSDQPRQIEYHGEKALWTRDFGSAWLDQYPDLTCVDYGFSWKRMGGNDNATWWLFRK